MKTWHDLFKAPRAFGHRWIIEGFGLVWHYERLKRAECMAIRRMMTHEDPALIADAIDRT